MERQAEAEELLPLTVRIAISEGVLQRLSFMDPRLKSRTVKRNISALWEKASTYLKHRLHVEKSTVHAMFKLVASESTKAGTCATDTA